ncbi:phosphoribosylglycinamide formyltransferase [bacterium]|nr:MAG: phosphoribosylglycinamide formyltransferase [bacterium]
MERLAILVGAKGRGSNMVALLKACAEGTIPAEAYRVVAPREGTDAAANAGDVDVTVVEPGEHYGLRLVQALQGATIVCLAGFTRLLPVEVLHAFPGRVLNIHPSLLPRHGGAGMYGRRVHEAVLASGDAESGCSVHYVTDQYDEGDVILQGRCPVLPEDTPESLAARVLEVEHRVYPEAVARVLRGDAHE